MITSSLDIMRQNPGIYVTLQPAGVVFIEVEGDTFYQLKPQTFERDGILSPDGWNHHTYWNAIGPLARKDDK